MNFLIDHNLEGHAVLLAGSILNRERCVVRLVEIVLDINSYKGVSRLFIP